MDNWLYYIPIGTLWFGPVIAGLAAYLIHKRQELRLKTLVASITYLAIIAGCIALGISTVWQRLNFSLYGSIYICLCFILFVLASYKFKVVKYISITFAVLIVGIGYFSGTVGLLGIGFIVNGCTIEKSIIVNESIVCRLYSSGSAISKFRGHNLVLYRHLKYFPEIEVSVFEKEYNYFGLPKYVTPGFSGPELNITYDSLRNDVIVKGSISGIDTVHL